ncbi:hypothetical protein NKG94_28960 [Micromonospora sp. M12]
MSFLTPAEHGIGPAEQRAVVSAAEEVHPPEPAGMLSATRSRVASVAAVAAAWIVSVIFRPRAVASRSR